MKTRGCYQCTLWRRELGQREAADRSQTNKRVNWLIERLFEHRSSTCSTTEGASVTVRPVPLANKED